MSLSHGKIGHSSGRPAVMENLEKANFLPGHGKVREFFFLSLDLWHFISPGKEKLRETRYFLLLYYLESFKYPHSNFKLLMPLLKTEKVTVCGTFHNIVGPIDWEP